ncbi:MAG: class I SAM-dependent methyltransferase [Coriobacteriales bacterium]
MDSSTARILNDATARFYRCNAESFSSTRHAGWAGWEEALARLELQQAPQRIADIACGNMRFAAFAAQHWPGARMQLACVDSCAELAQHSLAPDGVDLRFEQRDIVGMLVEGAPLMLPRSQLAVCFGFMHHIPGSALRVEFLAQLLASLEPGGCAVVSLWQFMQEKGLAAKARQSTPRGMESLGLSEGQLEEGDFLLGWQGSEQCWRYCHSFTEEEARELAAAALERAGFSAQLQSFEADGRNGRLNRYLLFKLR